MHDTSARPLIAEEPHYCPARERHSTDSYYTSRFNIIVHSVHSPGGAPVARVRQINLQSKYTPEMSLFVEQFCHKPTYHEAMLVSLLETANRQVVGRIGSASAV